MPSSAIIDLAIGLTFVFGVTAAVSSAITEGIARFLGLRAAYLLTGLRELVDDGQLPIDLNQAKKAYESVRATVRGAAPVAAQPAGAQAGGAAPTPVALPAEPALRSVTNALLGSPVLGNQGVAGRMSSRKLVVAQDTGTAPSGKLPGMSMTGQTWHNPLSRLLRVWQQRRSLPAYISSSSFSASIVDLLLPDEAGQSDMDQIRLRVNALTPQEFPVLAPALQALAKNADDDVTKFRTTIENWYDNHMDRVSGWYKHRASQITVVVGLVLVVLLNINALTIGRTLYTETAVNSAISQVAASKPGCTTGESTQACLTALQGQVSAAAAAGLPIGWGTVRDCKQPGAHCNWLDQRGIFSRHGGSGWQLVLVLIGFLTMVISLIPGSQFWFGLLTKLGSLRSTGPKPASTTN